LDDALETAVNLAESDGVAAAGVLVTGSVVLVGEARTLLVRQQAADDRAGDGSGHPDDDWTEPTDSEDEVDGVEQEDVLDAYLTGETVEGERLSVATADFEDLDEDDPFADDAGDADDDRYAEWDAELPSDVEDEGHHGGGRDDR
jgi:dihydrofolate synthase/folylpolyglutamate synthase